MKRILSLFLSLSIPALAAGPLSVPDISANRALWPQEVTVATPIHVPIVVNGVASGSMDLPPGRSYAVESVTTAGVVVNAEGTPITVPPGDTDLLTRSEAIQARLAAATLTPQPLAATPPPAPKPVLAATPAPTPDNENHFAAKIPTDLVSLQDGKLVPYDAEQLKHKKYLAIYYSGGWCPGCREFSPKLVSWYKVKRHESDDFEVIFYTNDKDPAAMLDYMKTDHMPWPALSYAAVRKSNVLYQYEGNSIPSLVVLDGDGKVLSDTHRNGQYAGPDEVLKDLTKLIRPPEL